MRTIQVLLVGALLSAFSSQAQAIFTQAQKMADYQQMVTIIEQSYAPVRWKQKTIGLDWNTHVETYRNLVKKTTSDEEFYGTLTKFLAGLKDAHVSAAVPSTYQATLGFLCDYVNGKVLIDLINPTQLPESFFPFKRGDQLLEIGGVPVEDLMNEITKYTHTGYELSAKRLAAAFLTYRRQSRGLPVPSGVTTVKILPRGETQAKTIAITWINKGRAILNPEEFSPAFDSILVNKDTKTLLKEKLDQLALNKLALNKDMRRDLIEMGIKDIGAAESMFKLPADAVQNPAMPFTAVTFTRQGKKIGILRLPEYGDEVFALFVAKALQDFESSVDVLVIDQANNPGGYVSTVSTILGYFVDKSAKDAMFMVRPSQSWLDQFSSINQLIQDMLQEDPTNPDANALNARFQYLENLIWNSLQHKVFLTDPISLDFAGGMGVVNPSEIVRFTKPVLLLVNEFDFSGGDVFPSLMKDNGRAVLFGNRTTGAGGNVEEKGPLTNSHFKFNLTESLIQRPNGQLIENLGVAPDIQYNITEDDFVNGYHDYFQNFTCEALKLVNAPCAADLFIP